MTRIRVSATTVLLALVASTLAVFAGASTASAAPPVTVADAAELYAGGSAIVTPLKNDSDPDGDELALCRLGEKTYRNVDVFISDDELLFFALPDAKPKTYTFTYYACDFETLVPGTITLTVLPPPKITAKALPGQPGKIRVKNPADVPIVFAYGSFREEDADARVKIPKRSVVTLVVRRTRIDWVAYSPKLGFVVVGHIKGIKLPRGTAAPAADTRLPARIAQLWQG